MKSDSKLDEQIGLVSDFVNSFERYDQDCQAQTTGFLVLNALRWSRGHLHRREPILELLELPGAPVSGCVCLGGAKVAVGCTAKSHIWRKRK